MDNVEDASSASPEPCVLGSMDGLCFRQPATSNPPVQINST